ncbi:hypothetical protein QAD02_020716 [Eretmocerus hayati]|uniref:Uncharacterized protein n=1 Tax=Eretmocerus hayati TaxID=131215 RepID=A0ACC2PN87_9HYME|nr:hypothetical protein QAD02_020716 [Eretmocerus hayati]
MGIVAPDDPNVAAERRKKFAARPTAFSPRQTLTRTNYKGVYINYKEYMKSLDTSDSVLERLQVPYHVPNHGKIESLTEAEEMFEAILEANADKKVNPIHLKNERLLQGDINPFKGILPGHIAHNGPKDLDPNNEATLGALHPSVYYAGEYSFSEIHPEDGYAESVLIMRSCRGTGLGKIWILIAKDHFPRFNSIMVKIAQDLMKNRAGFHEWETNCTAPVNHKCFVVTPTFLRENKIRYEVICQYEGDMIVVDQFRLHQVVNVEENESIAMNFGSRRWSESAQRFFRCACEKSAIRFLSSVSKNGHPCPAWECPCISHTKAEMQRHLKLLHRKSPVKRLFVCHRCQGNYASQAHFTVHLQSCGSKRRKRIKKMCHKCNKSFVELKYHERKCQRPCPLCDKPQSARVYARHLAFCELIRIQNLASNATIHGSRDKYVQTDIEAAVQPSAGNYQGTLTLSELCFACGGNNSHLAECVDRSTSNP